MFRRSASSGATGGRAAEGAAVDDASGRSEDDTQSGRPYKAWKVGGKDLMAALMTHSGPVDEDDSEPEWTQRHWR